MPFEKIVGLYEEARNGTNGRARPKIGDASTNELLSETLRLMRNFENQAWQRHIPEMRKTVEYLEMMLGATEAGTPRKTRWRNTRRPRTLGLLWTRWPSCTT